MTGDETSPSCEVGSRGRHRLQDVLDNGHAPDKVPLHFAFPTETALYAFELILLVGRELVVTSAPVLVQQCAEGLLETQRQRRAASRSGCIAAVGSSVASAVRAGPSCPMQALASGTPSENLQTTATAGACYAHFEATPA